MRLALSLALAIGLLSGSATVTSALERLNFSWPVNVGPLNPHLYTPNQMFAQSMVYEPLVRYGKDGTLEPWLAESWEVSGDGRAYTFHLRQGVTFSNGETFDAEAVVANFEAILANRERHAWLELANQIEKAEALDDHRVRLTLKDSYYPVLEELALPRPFRFVAPSQFVDGGTMDGIAAPIGTGPFVLAETRLGEHDLFRRNETYWGKAPALDEVDVKVIPDPNSRAIALQTGEIDLIYGADGPISPDSFKRFEAMDGYVTALSPPYETRTFALNTNRGPTRDIAVRKAINHAVDKDTMISAVLSGTHERADTLFEPGVPYADIGLKPYAFDPVLAERLLDEAGWTRQDGGTRSRDGEPLRIELCFTGNDAVLKSMAEIVQADLARIGIAVELVGEEESSVYARQRDGRFGMIFNTTWGKLYDPHAFLSAMRVPAHADYQAQLGLDDKAEIDGKIGKVLVTRNEEERRALYREIITRLHDAAVYLPLVYTNAMLVARPGLGKVPFGALSSEVPFEAIEPGDL
ncbi:nickel ABC transporter, nickel/metallophore periplasmic binding protein [Fulvimarina endophytica]|uniref:Nickel ABC transporter, nickel/metallophore periplasmic binding protein n=1 Tax=Fulvimarina endophytica TaxID=2293836 RepID=A0A371WZT2_9HYPH|nr:nickel ABC transporter substrate-binding protein [Fulvimarina endophytica]RFC62501.1 nickel ABC transporter, nickel/metallophore periplasmic binding protein [Fulvimarina endophytica]